MTIYSNPDVAVYRLFKDDPSLQTLLGAEAEDSRVYRDYPLESIALSDAKKAYLILSLESIPTVEGSGFGDDQLWQVRVVAKDAETRDLVAEQVRTLIVYHFTYKDSIQMSNHHHLGGGNPNNGPHGFSDDLEAYAVNIRFTFETILKQNI